MKKILPKIMTDEEAESLLSDDLSEYLTAENFKANFTPVSFEFTPKKKMCTFPKTAAQYGRELRAAEVKPPAPFLTREFLREISDRIYVYRVGKRLVKNVFLLVNNGYGTLYVKPSYRDYRAAYASVFPDCLLGCDIDHLAPRSKYSNEHFIALGHIDSNINRSHNDTMEDAEIIMKGMNRDNKGIEMLTPYPRAREYGLYVLNGYIRPLSSLNVKMLTMVDIHEIID